MRHVLLMIIAVAEFAVSKQLPVARDSLDGSVIKLFCCQGFVQTPGHFTVL